MHYISANTAGFSWVIMKATLQNLVHYSSCHVGCTAVLAVGVEGVEAVTLQEERTEIIITNDYGSHQ